MELFEINKRLQKQKERKRTWDITFQDTARYIIPHKAVFNLEMLIDGSRRDYEVYDTTAIHSNELLASSLHGMLVDYSGEWFDIELTDPSQNASQTNKQYLDNARKVMHSVMSDPKSNFSAALDEAFLAYGPFGTNCIICDEHEESGVHYDSWNISEIFPVENQWGFVDTVYRVYRWEVDKIKAKLQLDSLPAGLEERGKASPDEKIEIVHVIMPRENNGGPGASAENMPFASIWYSPNDLALLKEGGFPELPVFVSRWRKFSQELFGRGPGLTALGDIKMLNQMRKDMIEATEKLINPPLDVPHNGYIGKIRTFAKGINHRKTLAREGIQPLQLVGNLPFAMEDMRDLENRIRSIFFNDQLQLAQGPDMTAYEVAQRQSEKLRLMAPTLGRVQTELFVPLLERTFNILERGGWFEDRPSGMANQPYKIRFTNQLSRLQEQQEVESIVTTLQTVIQTGMSEIDPSVLDIFDFEESARVVARVMDYPAIAMRKDKDIEALRKQRQQVAQKNQAIAKAQQAAEITQKIQPGQGSANG